MLKCSECGAVADGWHAVGCPKDHGQQVRYDKAPEYDMSIHTNPDAAAWVKFFRECNPDCNVPDDLMLTWFANAMMAMHDHIKGGPVVLTDGSAFFVADVPSPPVAA